MKKTAFEKTPEFERFKRTMGKLVAVPKAELDEEIRKHDEQSKASGSRPGPKPRKKRATR